jgi:hypothetical protein
MKRILFLSSLILVLISCEKLGDLKIAEIIPGGCNLENSGAHKGLLENIDKVTYTLEDGNLRIFVGFNATCCAKYTTSSDINNDVILIRITTTQPGMCNCLCYYTYDFTFTGRGENYNYKVTVDDRSFSGKIKH